MLALRNTLLIGFMSVGFLAATRFSAVAAGYSFVEGYNVLDTNNFPGFTGTAGGTNYAGTAGQERDIAVDSARGIIYIGHGTGTVPDGRGTTTHISAFVVTNGARAGSNFRDTGLIGPASGQPTLSFCQSLAYDRDADKLWVLGSPLGANPVIFSAPGGTVGGAPNGDGVSAVNAALTKAFQLDTNLLDVGVYTQGVAGLPGRGGQPRGFAVRTVNGTNTTVYVGMGNHVQAWSNSGTNQTWRRIWATLRPPAGNLTSSRVATAFTGVNGLAVDDDGNCYFSVQTTGGRIWTVRPSLIQSLPDPMSLDYNDLAFGGSSEREVLTLIYSSASLLVTPPQSITFARFDAQRSLFVSFLPGTLQRGVTRLDVDDNFSFTNSGAYMPARAVDGFGIGQPAGGQDSILATMRLKSTPGVTQPYGATSGLLYTDVDSVTNPTYIYADAFVIDTNKGQTIPTAAVMKVRLPSNTNPPSITTQPQPQTLLEGGSIGLSVAAVGMLPLHYRWQSNSVDISGATNQNLTVVPAFTNQSGLYRVIITNALGSITSAVVQVTVNPLVRSTAMNPLWSLAPGSRPYLTTDDRQRGLTYNPDTHDLLVVSRAPSAGVYALDSETGADLYQLGLGSVVTGGTFVLNRIAASDDGHIYAANLAQNGEDLRIYIWNLEIANDTPLIAYAGNPTPGTTNRWGDTFDVRGSGNDIQIIAGTRAGKIVAVFTTTDEGAHFTATPVTVPDAVNGSFGLGLAFGAGNTFWGKGDGSNTLRQVQFDLSTSNGTTIHSYASSNYTASALALAVETNLNLLASISIENPDNLRLYTLDNLSRPPRLVDQELFPTDNDNINATGALDFGGGNLYALDSNNGIIAVSLGAIPPPPPGNITINRNGNSVSLTWSGSYILQSASVVTGPFNDVAGAVSGYTEIPAPGTQKFFRLRN